MGHGWGGVSGCVSKGVSQSLSWVKRYFYVGGVLVMN